MKKSSKIVIVLLLSFGVIGSVMAIGYHQFADPQKRIEYAINKATKKLDLDATQKQNFIALKDELIESKDKIEQNGFVDHQALFDLVEGNVFDQAQALEVINSKTAIVNERAPEVLAALGTFLDSLNVDQKQKIVDAMEDRMDRHHH